MHFTHKLMTLKLLISLLILAELPRYRFSSYWIVQELPSLRILSHSAFDFSLWKASETSKRGIDAERSVIFFAFLSKSSDAIACIKHVFLLITELPDGIQIHGISFTEHIAGGYEIIHVFQLSSHISKLLLNVLINSNL